MPALTFAGRPEMRNALTCAAWMGPAASRMGSSIAMAGLGMARAKLRQAQPKEIENM